MYISVISTTNNKEINRKIMGSFYDLISKSDQSIKNKSSEFENIENSNKMI